MIVNIKTKLGRRAGCGPWAMGWSWWRFEPSYIGCYGLRDAGALAGRQVYGLAGGPPALRGGVEVVADDRRAAHASSVRVWGGSCSSFIVPRSRMLREPAGKDACATLGQPVDRGLKFVSHGAEGCRGWNWRLESRQHRQAGKPAPHLQAPREELCAGNCYATDSRWKSARGLAQSKTLARLPSNGRIMASQMHDGKAVSAPRFATAVQNTWLAAEESNQVKPIWLQTTENDLDAQGGEGVADAVDDLHELGVGFLKAFHGGNQTLVGQFTELGVGFGAGGFVGGKFGEIGDAIGLFAVGLGELADLGFQAAEEGEQFRLALAVDGIGRADLGLNLADGLFNHILCKLTPYKKFGKIKWLAHQLMRLLKVLP